MMPVRLYVHYETLRCSLCSESWFLRRGWTFPSPVAHRALGRAESCSRRLGIAHASATAWQDTWSPQNEPAQSDWLGRE